MKLRDTGATGHPLLRQLLIARTYHMVTGHSIPFEEVDEFDDVTIMTLNKLRKTLEEMSRPKKLSGVERRKQLIRAAHPTFAGRLARMAARQRG